MTDGIDAARSRRESRERAVELAYEAEIRGLSVNELLETLVLPAPPFAIELLNQTERRRDEADKLIEAKSSGWTIARMPVLDLLVMRVAVVELLEGRTPPGVILAEAVELAGRYSTEESSRFVNGVLAAIADDFDTGS